MSSPAQARQTLSGNPYERADADLNLLLRPENRQKVIKAIERLQARAKSQEEAERLARQESIRHEHAELAKTDLDGSRARCKSLAGFIREAWHVLEPETPLVWGWHLDALCDHLVAVTDGRITRLLITVPPGSSKSLIVSVLWPAWEWSIGRRGLRYLTTSYDEVNITRDCRKHRDLVQSEWYRALFPEVRLTRTAEGDFANSDQGGRLGATFVALTGKRGDRLIYDDPHSAKKAESDEQRFDTTNGFREGATNRLNDQKRSAIIVIMQRLHHKDVAGVILEVPMGYCHLNIPMEFETVDGEGNPLEVVPTEIGWVDPRTFDGELMDPVRFDEQVVADLKRDLGPYAWNGQYQQRPVPREGGLFQRSYFKDKIIKVVPPGTVFCRHWDLAATKLKVTDTKGARTAGVKMGRAPDGRFIICHLVAIGEEGKAVEDTIEAQAQLDGDGVMISLPQDPGQAGKVQKRAYLNKLAGYNVRIQRETGDKVTRAEPFARQCEGGNVYLLEGPWNDEYVDEVCLFPGGPRKDVVDASSGAFGRLLPKEGAEPQTAAGAEVIQGAESGDDWQDPPDDEEGEFWG